MGYNLFIVVLKLFTGQPVGAPLLIYLHCLLNTSFLCGTASILLFYCFHNKLPQNQQLKLHKCISTWSEVWVGLADFPAQSHKARNRVWPAGLLLSGNSANNPLPRSFRLLAVVGLRLPFSFWLSGQCLPWLLRFLFHVLLHLRDSKSELNLSHTVSPSDFPFWYISAFSSVMSFAIPLLFSRAHMITLSQPYNLG